MEILKQATALPIFGFVIWLVWLFTQSAGIRGLKTLLVAFLLLGIAGWILGRWPARRVPLLAALLIIATAVAAPLYFVSQMG
jgi:thiol:disulfide interchange protein DsbD